MEMPGRVKRVILVEVPLKRVEERPWLAPLPTEESILPVSEKVRWKCTKYNYKDCGIIT